MSWIEPHQKRTGPIGDLQQRLAADQSDHWARLLKIEIALSASPSRLNSQERKGFHHLILSLRLPVFLSQHQRKPLLFSSSFAILAL